MYKSINFTNYRIFAERQVMELAPVTVVFGKNNVGKSAILRLPLLIKSILGYREGELFDQSVDGLRICEDYRDVVYGKGTRAVEIGVTDGENSAEVHFFVEPKGKRRTHSEKIVCRKGGEEFEGDLSKLEGSLDVEIEYLKSIRDFPKDGFFSMAVAENEARCGGMFAYRRLVRDVTDHGGELLEKVSDWYRRTFDGWGIDVDTSRTPVYSLTLNHGMIKNNIIDGGAGIAQSLPVITASATDAPSSRLYIFEEPETHLHPEAHGEMAEFIAEQACSSKGRKCFLIESHSVNFIIRLRTLVASGMLDPKDLALYYVEFDPGKETSSLRRVEVLPDGSVKGWPEKVFKETLEETMSLRRAQLKREEAPGHGGQD